VTKNERLMFLEMIKAAGRITDALLDVAASLPVETEKRPLLQSIELAMQSTKKAMGLMEKEWIPDEEH
jgi:hypothetical protein